MSIILKGGNPPYNSDRSGNEYKAAIFLQKCLGSLVARFSHCRNFHGRRSFYYLSAYALVLGPGKYAFVECFVGRAETASDNLVEIGFVLTHDGDCDACGLLLGV
mgnify:CR=1 FL=1